MIRVVVGLLRDGDGRVLINRRQAGTHRAGAWEFPGGKYLNGEDSLTALRRELDEELAIVVNSAAPLMTLIHEYPERTVELNVWDVVRHTGIAIGNEGQEICWVYPQELKNFDLLEADAPIVAALLGNGEN